VAPLADERDLIDRYFTAPAGDSPDVVLGIGDDAAVTRLPAGSELVTATDMLCQGTHFPEGFAPRALGHRCLAVNLSDLAAMSAQPRWATLALSMEAVDGEWLAEFSAGFFALARKAGIQLIGGDTVRGPLSVSVTVLGSVPTHEWSARSGARPGDGLYVTGTLGDAAAGLNAILEGAPLDDHATYLVERFSRPQPRIEAGRALRGLATSMIDISDGLGQDLARLMDAGGTGAVVALDDLPLSSQLLASAGRRESQRLAIEGGDDYELLFSAPILGAGVLARIAESADCRFTRIGEVVANSGVEFLRRDGAPYVAGPGFAHFDEARK
jgi:thiamine-monophosphate kinase